MLAKSKLKSIETLMSQALIDLDVSHEEFKTILNEKEKYEKMKESIRNVRSRNELEIGILEKIVKIHNLKKNIIIVCVYKMVEISTETWKKCGIETATFNNLAKNKNIIMVKNA